MHCCTGGLQLHRLKTQIVCKFTVLCRHNTLPNTDSSRDTHGHLPRTSDAVQQLINCLHRVARLRRSESRAQTSTCLMCAGPDRGMHDHVEPGQHGQWDMPNPAAHETLPAAARKLPADPEQKQLASPAENRWPQHCHCQDGPPLPLQHHPRPSLPRPAPTRIRSRMIRSHIRGSADLQRPRTLVDASMFATITDLATSVAGPAPALMSPSHQALPARRAGEHHAGRRRRTHTWQHADPPPAERACAARFSPGPGTPCTAPSAHPRSCCPAPMAATRTSHDMDGIGGWFPPAPTCANTCRKACL